MVLGIYIFFSPLVELLGYIPFVGNFLGGVVGFVILLAAFIVCIPLFLFTFSLAWLVYHPRVGVLLLLVSLLVAGLIIMI